MSIKKVRGNPQLNIHNSPFTIKGGAGEFTIHHSQLNGGH
jgi:hypothetical protein